MPQYNLDMGTAHLRVLVLGCLSASLLLATALPLQASESSKLSNLKAAASPYNPPLPPNLGAPKGRTGGGASRGTCSQSQAMHAVLPRNVTRSYSLTASEHPTFWFYLPNRPHPETRLEFVLQDAADRYVYQTVFTQANASAGLISVTVPEQSPPLIANAAYSWTLSLQCAPTHPSQMVFIRGVIQRINLSTAITTSDQAITARLYAQQGLWYDAITILAQALQVQPANLSIAQAWKDLLEQSGLTELQPPDIAIKQTNLTQIGSTVSLLKDPRAALKHSVHR